MYKRQGIRHIGQSAAREIAKHFKNIDALISASAEEIAEIDDIGMIMANSVREFFDEERNIKIIDEFKAQSVNTEYIDEGANFDNRFEGKTFVVTGTLETLKRAEEMCIRDSVCALTLLSSYTPQCALVVSVFDENFKIIGTLSQAEISDGILTYGARVKTGMLLREDITNEKQAEKNTSVGGKADAIYRDGI